MEESTKKNLIDWIIPLICLGLALAAVAIVYYLHQEGTALQRLTIVVGYVIVILVFFFGLMVLIAMATNKIDISGLLCEPTENKASISRFQLLIFTFVIAFCLVLIIIGNDPLKFPDIPSGILLLLGISASTYAVSKGITKSSGGPGGDGQPSGPDQTTVTTTGPGPGSTTTTVNNPTTVTTTTVAPPPPAPAPGENGT